MKRLILLMSLVLPAAGCASQADLIAYNRSTCTQIGFTPDTPEFRDCVLQLYSLSYWPDPRSGRIVTHPLGPVLPHHRPS